MPKSNIQKSESDVKGKSAPIKVPPSPLHVAYVLTGSRTAAILLTQMVYWNSRATIKLKGIPGWTCFTVEQWLMSTGLTDNEYFKAVVLLQKLGLIKTQRAHLYKTDTGRESLWIKIPSEVRCVIDGLRGLIFVDRQKHLQIKDNSEQLLAVKSVIGILANKPVGRILTSRITSKWGIQLAVKPPDVKRKYFTEEILQKEILPSAELRSKKDKLESYIVDISDSESESDEHGISSRESKERKIALKERKDVSMKPTGKKGRVGKTVLDAKAKERKDAFDTMLEKKHIPDNLEIAGGARGLEKFWHAMHAKHRHGMGRAFPWSIKEAKIMGATMDKVRLMGEATPEEFLEAVVKNWDAAALYVVHASTGGKGTKYNKTPDTMDLTTKTKKFIDWYREFKDTADKPVTSNRVMHQTIGK